MSLKGRLLLDDRGVSALIVAAGMVLFLGIAAMAIDLGLGFNERRQDQSAVDSGVMAGALSAVEGQAAVVARALEFAESNLPTTYLPGDWQTLWEGCVDPAAERNAGGFNFVALDAPPGWVPVDSANWCISFESARGLLRVKTPTQLVPTTFGRVLGVDELRTGAFAVAHLSLAGDGGILPFGLGLNANGHECLSSAPFGLVAAPCRGPASGNFGHLDGPTFGNLEIPTNGCDFAPKGAILAQNIAHGYDHIVVTKPDNLAAGEVRDECFNPLVDTLNTLTGFRANDVEDGLIGPVPPDGIYVYPARLGLSGPTISIKGRPVNNSALWSYLLDPSLSTSYGPDPLLDDGPTICAPATFDDSMPPFDWDGDGVDDLNESWRHMDACIDAYIANGYFGVIFNEAIAGNDARFAYAPQFWDPTLGPGNSWLHILRFRAVYIQTTVWKKGNEYVRHSPGEHLSVPAEPCVWLVDPSDPAQDMWRNCPLPSGSWSLTQMTAIVLPDDALPAPIRGDYTPSGGVNPFIIELYK